MDEMEQSCLLEQRYSTFLVNLSMITKVSTGKAMANVYSCLPSLLVPLTDKIVQEKVEATWSSRV